MTSSSHLRDGDAERMLRVLDDARHDDPGPVWPWTLLAGLERLMPGGTEVVYQELDPVHARWQRFQFVDEEEVPWFVVGADANDPEGEEEYFRLWWQDPMCSYRQRTGDLRSVIQASDFFPDRMALRDRPIFRDLGAGPGLAVMIVALPAEPGCERRLTVIGGEQRLSFSERDRAVLALLRPHLQEVWLDAERRRAGVPRLTPREWEVLALTAGGLSHAEVAARLHVAVSTVDKHMEHVRERLGVHTAAAAAARALPHAPRQALPRQR